MSRCLLLLCILLLAGACASDDATPAPLPTLIIPATQAAAPTQPPEAPTPAERQTRILEPWVAYTDTIRTGARQRWQFEGISGDQIRLRVIATTIETTLTVEDTNGDILATDAEQIEITLPTDGIYRVQVFASAGSGNYDIGLSYLDRPIPAEIAATALPQVVGVPTPVPVYAEFGTFISRLEEDAAVTGVLEPDGENHIYTFTGVAGQVIQLEMNRINGDLDPIIILYDPAGDPVAMDDDTGPERDALLRNVRLPQDGLYGVEAASDAAAMGGYSLRLSTSTELVNIPVTIEPTRTPTSQPTFVLTPVLAAINGRQLRDHIPVQAALDPGGVAIYSLEANAGDIITVGVTTTIASSLVPEIEMSDPDGNIAAAAVSQVNTGLREAIVEPFVVTISGVYQVFLTGDAGTGGPYVISYGKGASRLDVLRGPVMADIAYNAIIERTANRHLWTLDLQAGDIITASVNPTADSALDPLLELVRADAPDQIIASDDNGGGGRSPLLRDVQINQSGLYLLRVKSAQGATAGEYNLIWRYINLAPTQEPPLARGQILTAFDAVPDGEYAFYPFQGLAGQRVALRVTGIEAFDPVAALLAPDGTVIAEADDSPDGDLNPVLVVDIDTDGTYTLRVNGYLSGGAYEVQVEVLLTGN